MPPSKRGLTSQEMNNLALHIYWEAEKARNHEEFVVKFQLDQPTAFMLSDLIMRIAEGRDGD